MSSARSPAPERRVLLVAGTQTYLHGADFADPLATLDRLPDALRSIVATLAELGYAPESEGTREYLLDPSAQRLKDAIRVAVRSASVLVIYYAGHGMKPERGPYYLLTADSRPGLLADSALEARQFLDLVLRRDEFGEVAPDDEQPQVLVILDCCFSGAGGIEALKESLQAIGNPNVWFLASSSRVDYAQQGRFAAALSHVLLNPETGPSQEFLSLEWIAEKIKTAIGQRTPYFPPGGEAAGLAPFFPNRDYKADVAGLTVAEQHWMSRLRGVPEDSTTAGFYVTGHTGRVHAVQDLARWMSEPGDGGLAVVTGSPGSGKSAMLALPVLLTDTQHRRTLLAGAGQSSLITRVAGQFDGLSVLAVHAHGMITDQVAQVIARRAGHRSRSAAELLEELDETADPAPRIVIVDAVDEARAPGVLLTGLLVPLARRPELRVVIGTRRHVLPPRAETGLTVDLDADRYRDPQALADYARLLLLAAREADVPTPYQDRDDNLADTVAGAIASRATARPNAAGRAESFLLAQLMARAVRGRDQAIDVAHPAWTEQLPADVGAAFDEDLARLRGREPAVRALLTALAWARGPGLPWEIIWLPVARALVAPGAAVDIGEDDLLWLLDKAGAYVVEDLGPGGRSVFRPFHDLLAAHLRGESGTEKDADPAASGTRRRHARIERIITSGLLTTVPSGAQGRDWQSAHPYLRTYLAQHAAAAGTEALSDLVNNLDFLAVADPVTLSPLLAFPIPELHGVARIYRRARPLLGDDMQANAGYIQEAVRAFTNTTPERSAIRPRYRTHLAAIRRDDSLLALTGHIGWVESVAVATEQDGRLLLASGSQDLTVRVWDPLTGGLVGEPFTGHLGRVLSVGFGAGPGGRLLLASGSQDWKVRVWDPLTGEPAHEPLTGHIGPVDSVAFGTGPDGRLLLASGSQDQMVRVWDPGTGGPVGEPLPGHHVRVNSVAFGAGPDGRLLLASGSWDQTVRVWDPRTGTLIGQPLTGHLGPVSSVAFGAGPDGRPLLASGSQDHTVRLWDLAAKAWMPTLLRRSGVNSLGAAGRILAIGEDEGICMIELDALTALDAI